MPVVSAAPVALVSGGRAIVRDMPGVRQPQGADETVTILIPSIAD